MTYCDMITLLMTFFILIFTFSTRNEGSQLRLRDSILYGPGGTGVSQYKIHGQYKDSVVLRESLPAANYGNDGSDNAPEFSDPVIHPAQVVIQRLQHPSDKSLSEGYSLRVPAALFLEKNNQVSASGRSFLQVAAKNLRNLPFDLLIQVADPARMAPLFLLARFLVDNEGMFPGRIALGLRPVRTSADEYIWFTFSRRLDGGRP